MKQLQQGDVCLFSAKIPPKAKKRQGDVLREGETTGHAHRVTGSDFQLLQSDNRLFVSVVSDDCKVVHEEHKQIELPIGDYEVTPIHEYDHFLEGSRAVRD